MRKYTRLLISTCVVLALITGVALVSAQNDTSSNTNATPYLGITYKAADNGVEVDSVIPNSPAADAGLKAGDLITAANDTAVTNDNFATVIHGMQVGDTLTIDVTRDGESMQITATLAAQPQRPQRSTRRVQPFMAQRVWLGVSLEQNDSGAMIASVLPSSPAEKAGLMTGDVITAIDGQSITAPADVVTALQDKQSGDTVTLTITRDGVTQDITVTLESARDNMPTMMGDVVVYDGQSWRIISLSADSALAKAGVQNGDVITAINGDNLNPSDLADTLDGMDSSESVTLTIQRNNESMDLSVTAGDLEALTNFGSGFGFDPFGNGSRGNFGMMPGTVRLGVEFQTLNADIAAQHDLSVTEGALITNVQADSPAATAGLQVGDVVVSVDGDSVDARRTLSERLLAYDPGDTITLDVLRDGGHTSIDVTLGEANPMDMMPFGFNGDMPHFFFGPRGLQINPPGQTQPQAQPTPGANL